MSQEQRPSGRGQGAGGWEGASHFFRCFRRETCLPVRVEGAQPWQVTCASSHC